MKKIRRGNSDAVNGRHADGLTLSFWSCCYLVSTTSWRRGAAMPAQCTAQHNRISPPPSKTKGWTGKAL